VGSLDDHDLEDVNRRLQG
jgi:hypothetical protein